MEKCEKSRSAPAPKRKEEKRLSIAHCRKVLNRNGNAYTDEEVKKIRDFFYYLAEIEYENFIKKQPAP